jgi:hypothetical protein
LLRAHSANVLELLLDVTHAAEDLAAIILELRLAGATRANATAQLRHFCSSAGEPWEKIFELRKLHLELTFACASVPGEYVEDQLCSINDASVYFAFDVALLRWGKIMIKQNKVGARAGNRSGDFFQFAPPDQSSRVEFVASLEDFSYDFGPRTGREFAKLRHRFVDGKTRSKLGLVSICP